MKIYIVDDDESIRTSLTEILRDEEFDVRDFATGKSMLHELQRERPALVILDVWLGKEDGLDILDSIKEAYPALPVLMISGHGTIEQAVQATKKGAVDFLEKPLSLEGILKKISEILKVPDGPPRNENIALAFDEIIGASSAILKVKKAIAQAAGTNARVFIYGENGTGKELVSRSIYHNSKRSDKPFIHVNCAALSEDVIEEELFGRVSAGGFRPGAFENASGGTLFLYEVSALSLKMQARILRVLQEGVILRVESGEQLPVDVRLISAMNSDPQAAIRQGKFREDLYYRLNVIPVVLPPLRERQEDIPLLLDHYLRLTAEQHNMKLKRFKTNAVDALISYPWPGNVRELQNVVERLSIMSGEQDITTETVLDHLSDVRSAPLPFPVTGDLRKAREEFERNYITQALRKLDWNVSRAARYLGLERTNLHRKIKALGIEPEK